jgi:hypothetical protein
MKITLATVTEPKKIGKRFYIKEGEVKKETIGTAAGGTFEVVDVASMADFATLLAGLHPNHALIYGVPIGDILAFTSEKRIDLPAFGREKYITRTKKHFKWDEGAGILMFDYDPHKGDTALGKDDLVSAIKAIIGEFPYVWTPSSSSYIYNVDREVNGLKGQRLYIPIQNMRDAERTGEVLIKRLWLAGFGTIQLSRAGSMLPRCLFDVSVWQNQRLDFAGGAICIDPLVQRRGEPFVAEGAPIDSMALVLDLEPEENESYLKMLDAAKHAVGGDRLTVQKKWIDDSAAIMTGGAAVGSERHAQAVKTLTRALDSSVLYGDYLVHLSGDITVTVGEILDNPVKYHGMSILDPLEPEYNGWHKCAKLYVIDGRKNLYSQAHGGKNYKLVRTPRKVQITRGSIIEAQEATLDIMRLSGDLYDFGNKDLVRVENGGAVETNADMLWTWCARTIQYFSVSVNKKTDETTETPLDPQRDMMQRIVGIRVMRDLKKLDAVITAPVMRLDGTVLSRSGYDDSTRLFYDYNGEEIYIPRQPSRQEVIAAYDTLMYPFLEFPFEDSEEFEGINRSVFFAALLTAVMRPVLPTSPAFAFDAPEVGTGKTLLGLCCGILATGAEPPVTPHVKDPRGDDEVRKRIFSFLLSGKRVIIWDNVTGAFDSPSLAAALTSPTYEDRVLGGSTIATIPNKSLLILTGNNLTLTGDMPRRVLKCRINSGLSADSNAQRQVQYAVSPRHWCSKNRLDMVRAALVLLVGCNASGYNHGRGRLASFEEWDLTVRSTVCWLSEMNEFAGFLCDPAISAIANAEEDPETEVFSALFYALKDAFGEGYFSAKSAFNRGENEDILKEAIGECLPIGKPTVKGLGRLLTKIKGKNVGGMTILVKKDRDAGVNMFAIK